MNIYNAINIFIIMFFMLRNGNVKHFCPILQLYSLYFLKNLGSFVEVVLVALSEIQIILLEN